MPSPSQTPLSCPLETLPSINTNELLTEVIVCFAVLTGRCHNESLVFEEGPLSAWCWLSHFMYYYHSDNAYAQLLLLLWPITYSFLCKTLCSHAIWLYCFFLQYLVITYYSLVAQSKNSHDLWGFNIYGEYSPNIFATYLWSFSL